MTVLVIAWAPCRVEAQAGSEVELGPCRAVVVQPGSEELRLRILGQSQDVPCQLELVPPAEGAGCAGLAHEHAALAVMTVREPADAGSYEVVVCDAVADTEHVRSVTLERGDALGTSAAYEAVALVVRSAIVDIAAAHEARRLEHEREQSEERARQERAARAAEEQRRLEAERIRAAEEEADEPDDEEPDSAGPPRAFWFALGAEAMLPAMNTIAPALHGRALTELGFLRAGIGLAFGLPADSRGDDDQARLSIARHTALALALVAYELEPGWTLETGVHAGVTAITRSTRARIAGVQPTAAVTHWSAVLGLELGLSMALLEPIGLRPHLALDVVPGAPAYAYQDVTATGEPAGQTVRSRALPVQPRFGITFFAEL